MTINLLSGDSPILSVAMGTLPTGLLTERFQWASEAGFTGVELPAHGGTGGFHTPDISLEEREVLATHLKPFRGIALTAPYQESFDLTLVSPSAAIRRASLSEIWSVCRFAGMVGGKLSARPIVLVRSGMPPLGTPLTMSDHWLLESLGALQRTAQEQNVLLGVLSRDRFRRLADLDGFRSTPLAYTGIALDIEYLLDMGETLPEIVAFLEQGVERIVYLRVPATTAIATTLAPVLHSLHYAGMITLAGTTDMATLQSAHAAWQQNLA